MHSLTFLFLLKAIEDFLIYLKEWKSYCLKNNLKFPISSSTFNGLIITLKSTLEILEYLIRDRFYEFFLTTRINQDAIEVL